MEFWPLIAHISSHVWNWFIQHLIDYNICEWGGILLRFLPTPGTTESVNSCSMFYMLLWGKDCLRFPPLALFWSKWLNLMPCQYTAYVWDQWLSACRKYIIQNMATAWMALPLARPDRLWTFPPFSFMCPSRVGHSATESHWI